MSEDKSEAAPSTPTEKRDWHTLAERAAHESDPKKLIDLVQRLCDMLDEERAARSGLHSTTANNDGSPGTNSK